MLEFFQGMEIFLTINGDKSTSNAYTYIYIYTHEYQVVER